MTDTIKTYKDHLLAHPMMGAEAALMLEVQTLRAAITLHTSDGTKALVALKSVHKENPRLSRDTWDKVFHAINLLNKKVKHHDY